MSIAENIVILYDAGHEAQAVRMAKSESISVGENLGEGTSTYFFLDGSAVVSGEATMEVMLDAMESARKLVVDLYGVEKLKVGESFAEREGYDSAEEFLSLVMSKILYSDEDLKLGARFAVEPGSLT